MNIAKEKYVWYVSYGSNLSKDRLMSYINASPCPKYGINQPSYNRCIDISMPIKDKLLILPFKLFFAGQSRNWGNKSTAYIRRTGTYGFTYARAYLISWEQYKHIYYHEGGNYSYQIKLDNIDGYQAYTFTSSPFRDHTHFHGFSDKYLQAMIDGLKEMNVSNDEINKYIEGIKNENNI